MPLISAGSLMVAIKSVEKRVNHPGGWLVSPDGKKAAFIKGLQSVGS